jgi:hypothetical protein
MRELTELLDRLGIADPTTGRSTGAFELENAVQVLRCRFRDVVLRRYDDGLEVTEVGPLVEYAQSMMGCSKLQGALLDRLAEAWERELELQGVIRITKDSGMLEAVVADAPMVPG